MYDSNITDIIPAVEDFCDTDKKYQKKYKLTKKDTIKLKDSHNVRTSSIPVPYIEDCKLVFSNRKIYYLIKYSLDGNIHTLDTRLPIQPQLLRLKYFKLDPNNELLIFLTEYFTYVVVTLTNDFSSSIEYGWRKENSETKNYLYLNKYTDFYAKQTVDDSTLYDFLNCLIQYPNLAIVFAYGLYSISLHRFIYYDKLKDLQNCEDDIILPLFSLCLYGKIERNKELTLKQIASIFLDYARLETSSKDNFNCCHNPHLSVHNLDMKMNSLCSLADIPLIIYGSGNKAILKSNNPIITQMQNLQETFVVKTFPVYISQSPIYRDCILNINCSNITDIDKTTTKATVHWLLGEYISFLEELPCCNANPMDPSFGSYHSMHHIIPDEEDTFKNEELFNPYLREYCQQLLIALKRFKCFIHEKHLSFECKLDDIISNTTGILYNMALDCEKAHILQKVAPIANTVNINKIFSKVLKEL